MSYCVYCHGPYELKTSWRLFLGSGRGNALCSICQSKLQPIIGEICERCGRSFSELDPQYRYGNFCSDCLKWEKDETWKGLLAKNRSIYSYNDFLKEVISRYKYRGDAELVQLFAEPIKKLYDRIFPQHVIVPIPLSVERQYERGFNQAELLAYTIGDPVLALVRISDEEKQSKKNRVERLKPQVSPLFVTENSLKKYIENYDIIIIDDIYTTGATLRQAAKALKCEGARSISSITIAR